MAEEDIKITVLENGNMVIENMMFAFGQRKSSNFRGEEQQYVDKNKPQFEVKIPEDSVEPLRKLGWNVKQWEKEEEGADTVYYLNVKVHPNSATIKVRRGDEFEELDKNTMAIIDRLRFEKIDVEIRKWEYDPVAKPGKFSSALNDFYGVIRTTFLSDKYGE